MKGEERERERERKREAEISGQKKDPKKSLQLPDVECAIFIDIYNYTI